MVYFTLEPFIDRFSVANKDAVDILLFIRL